MNEELTNLLPPDRKKQLRSEYLGRLCTLAVVTLSFLLVATVLLRGPLLVYVFQKKLTSERELTALTIQLNDSGNTEASGRLKILNDNLSYLSRQSTTTTGTEVLTSVTSAPHQGIYITGISYSAGAKGMGAKVVLTGKASTRQSLQAYTDTLVELLHISVDLPISAYAKETDIPFTMTLSGFF